MTLILGFDPRPCATSDSLLSCLVHRGFCDLWHDSEGLEYKTKRLVTRKPFYFQMKWITRMQAQRRGGGVYSITFFTDSLPPIFFPKSTPFIYLYQVVILQGQAKAIEFPMIATFSRAPLNTCLLKTVYWHDLTKLTGLV